MKKINGKFTIIPNNMITATDITGNEFRILCYLCRCSGTDDKCFPSLENIHRETGIGLSTVKKSIPKLVKAGYIQKINRKKCNGGLTSNLYCLTNKVYN